MHQHYCEVRKHGFLISSNSLLLVTLLFLKVYVFRKHLFRKSITFLYVAGILLAFWKLKTAEINRMLVGKYWDIHLDS